MRNNLIPIVAVLGLCLAAGLAPVRAFEVCWVADAAGELSFVRAELTEGSPGRYLFHGHAFRLPGGTLQPFDGNAELVDGVVLGALTKLERNDRGGEIWLESYHGLFEIDLATKDGTIEGVLTECLTPPTDPPTCNVLNTGVIDLLHDADCDPET